MKYTLELKEKAETKKTIKNQKRLTRHQKRNYPPQQLCHMLQGKWQQRRRVRRRKGNAIKTNVSQIVATSFSLSHHSRVPTYRKLFRTDLTQPNLT